MIVAHDTTVGWIAEACGGRITAGDPAMTIDTVTTDSRELGGKNLFIPLVGGRFDGHDYIRGLTEGGRLRAYLTMRAGHTDHAALHGVAEVMCDDTLGALGTLAARHRDAIDPGVIAITGTNGKTTTKELVFAILNSRRRCLKNEKNYNNEIGVPGTLLALRTGHEIAVIEMGMNHPGELDRLSRIARPDLAVITNVGEGHLEFLGSVENVARAKSEIMSGMKAGATLLVNRDMQCFDLVMGTARDAGLSTTTFGLSKDAQVRPDSFRLAPGSVGVVFGG
ncbi:MAG: UDP-N-acetylmuramoyl-tripeptide--D-alanyl-D-alanine ligase, partial [Chrysiogenales bacterium]